MASHAAMALRRAAGALPIALAAGAMLRAHASAQPTPASSRPTFEPCPEVSCKSKEELAAMFGGLDQRPRRFSAGSGSKTGTAATAGTAAVAAAGAAAAAAAPLPPSDCPLDREELGRRAWGFLHSVAAYYPEAPSAEERAAAEGLVAALRHLYPCTHCRAALAKDIEVNPPRLGSRTEFVLWVCEQHNMVNAALGKPTFPCSLPDLDARWRTGRKECWGGAATAQTAEESFGQAPDDA